MTPKEKAKELCDNYSKLVLYSTDVFDKKLVPEIREFVKQCAIIAVDEIISELAYIQNYVEDNMNKIAIYISYWQEVKQEIEKL